VKLHDLGRQVIGVAPTAAYGQLHPDLKLSKPTISQNDTLLVKMLAKKKPLNGKKLVVISWGPDVKMVAKTLVEEKLECDLFILTYMKPPNSLVKYLDEYAMKGMDTEVICVDANPNANFLGPVILQMKRLTGYPEMLTFTECTVDNAYVPYGIGDGLLKASDVIESLKMRGIIEGGASVAKRTVSKAAPKTAMPKASEVPTLPAGTEEVVMAPMDGEGVVVKFIKRVGDPVSVDDLIAEIESDKANIEVTSPIDGVVSEFHCQEGTEMNVSPETKICTVKAVDAPSKPKIKPPTADFGSVIVNAPMDADTATISYKLKVGDACELDDLIAEVESDKATIEVTAPCDGVITELFLKEGEEMKLTMDMKICSLTRTAEIGSSIVTPFATSLGTPMPGSSMFVPGTNDQTRVLTRHELAMVENMTVRAGDTRVFFLEEQVEFAKIATKSKGAQVTPVVTMVKGLADALRAVDGNKKLTPDQRNMKTYGQVDIGVAVDLEGQLKVAVIRDCANKTIGEISADIKMFSAQGAKLSAADQNLDKVCWVVSSMGKNAPHTVIPVLPKGTAGIIGVGRTDETGKATLTATICHATMTGLEGSKIFRAFVEKCI